MILDIAGYKLRPELGIHAVSDAPLRKGVYPTQRPKYLVPLEEANWPSEVVSRVVKAYTAVGLQNPLKQKLVEPSAIVFGGKYSEGVTDLTSVNWDMVGDYFEWEAQAAVGNYDESVALQKKAKAKWGGIWSHRQVYIEYD